VQAAYATIFPKEAMVYWVWGDTGSVTRSVGTLLVQGGGDPERRRAQKDYACHATTIC